MPSQQQFSQDSIIGKAIGHYVVRHKLEEGGMGSVYIVEHPSIGKWVALKVRTWLAVRERVLAQDRAVLPQRSFSSHLLWPALLDGRWSLLDAFMVNGMRYLVAYENPPGVTLHALSPRQRTVVDFVLAGRSGKWIAYELQISESTVARAFRTALDRIGAADEAVLVGVQTARFEPLEGLDAGVELAMARLTPTVVPPVRLSAAERAVLTGIVDGKHIATIARERGTSPRTVSNQVSSIYKKLGASSRREMLALLRRPTCKETPDLIRELTEYRDLVSPHCAAPPECLGDSPGARLSPGRSRTRSPRLPEAGRLVPPRAPRTGVADHWDHAARTTHGSEHSDEIVPFQDLEEQE